MTDSFTHGYALFIGISDYEHVNRLPPQVLNDVQEVANVFLARDLGGYAKSNVRILKDRDATREAILREIAWLASHASMNDTVVIYFSGHGGRTRDAAEGVYLLPSNADLNRLGETTISATDFSLAVSKIKSNRVVVILDACHAGGIGFVKSTDGVFKSGWSRDAYDNLTSGTGRVVMASSRADEVSLISTNMNTSVFTHHVLEGLKGGAHSRGDGVLRILDVFHYVSDNVSRSSSKQHPIFKANDLENNFPLVLFHGGTKGASVSPTLAPRPRTIDGPTRVLLCRRLVDRWTELAMYYNIHSSDQAKFPKGDEPRSILIWLEQRNRLDSLRDAFRFLGFDDLVELLDSLN